MANDRESRRIIKIKPLPILALIMKWNMRLVKFHGFVVRFMYNISDVYHNLLELRSKCSGLVCMRIFNFFRDILAGLLSRGRLKTIFRIDYIVENVCEKPISPWICEKRVRTSNLMPAKWLGKCFSSRK